MRYPKTTFSSHLKFAALTLLALALAPTAAAVAEPLYPVHLHATAPSAECVLFASPCSRESIDRALAPSVEDYLIDQLFE